jgi:hypothetical protein
MAAPTITSIGTRTTQITLNKSTFVQLKDAVKNAMTGLTLASSATFSNGGTTGWDLIDEYRYGVGSSMGASPKLYQVFRSKNKDGVTYKNIIFCWNQVDNVVDIRTCERWGTSTEYNAATNAGLSNHSITNEAWSNYDAASIGYKLDACDFLINLGPRWALAHAYINSEPCSWAGVFEIARNDPLDTAVPTNPCWGLITSVTFFGNHTNEIINNQSGTDYPLIAMPSVMKNGARVTGLAACTDFGLNTGLSYHPSFESLVSGKSFAYTYGNAFSYLKNNGWDNTKRLCMPMSAVAGASTAAPTPLGQIFGLKILYPTGNNMNRIKLYIDSDGNFSNTGTNQDHFLLMNHGPCTATAIAGTQTTKTTIGNLATNPEYGQIHSVGSAYFVCMANTGNKVKRVDAFTGSTTDVLTFTGAYSYSKYDGENYLYVSTTAAFYKINVWSLVVTTSATSPIRAFGINADYVFYDTATVSGTRASFSRITGGTGSTDDAISAAPSFNFTGGNTTNAGTWLTGMDFDSYGNMFFITAYINSGASGYAVPLRRVENNTSTETQSSTLISIQQAAGYQHAGDLKVISDNFIMCVVVWHTSAGASSSIYPGVQQQFYHTTYLPASNATITGLGAKSQGNIYSSVTLAGNGHAGDIMKINGYVVMLPKAFFTSVTPTYSVGVTRLWNAIDGTNTVSIGMTGTIVGGFGGKANSAVQGRSGYYDGARLILAGVESPYSTSLCIYSGLHGAAQYNTTQCAQMAIPA